MAREKMPDLKRKGNWKNAPDDTPKKKATKTTKVTPAAKKETKSVPSSAVRSKPAKAKETPAKKQKPIRARLTDAQSPSRSTKGKVAVKRTAQNRSGDAALGQGRKSPAASKMNRMPGYSAGTEKKKDKYAMRRQARTGRK